MRAAGYALVNADCVVIGEEPRVAPHRDEMRDRLARALDVTADRVNVRATTTDGLGFTVAAKASPRRRWCWSRSNPDGATGERPDALWSEADSPFEMEGWTLEQNPPD